MRTRFTQSFSIEAEQTPGILSNRNVRESHQEEKLGPQYVLPALCVSRLFLSRVSKTLGTPREWGLECYINQLAQWKQNTLAFQATVLPLQSPESGDKKKAHVEMQHVCCDPFALKQGLSPAAQLPVHRPPEEQSADTTPRRAETDSRTTNNAIATRAIAANPNRRFRSCWQLQLSKCLECFQCQLREPGLSPFHVYI